MVLLLILVVSSISYDQSSTSVTLYWSILSIPNDVLVFEVGYNVRPNDTYCNTTDTLPEGYEPYSTTHNVNITVYGLEAQTCYVFGVRAISLKSGNFEEWETLQLYTRASMFK